MSVLMDIETVMLLRHDSGSLLKQYVRITRLIHATERQTDDTLAACPKKVVIAI